MRNRENVWAGERAHLGAVTERAAAPIGAKNSGVLAAADIDVFTRTTTFAILQSLPLDRGPSGPAHPASRRSGRECRRGWFRLVMAEAAAAMSLELDPSQGERDLYGRLLANV